MSQSQASATADGAALELASYPMHIDGRPHTTGTWLDSENPWTGRAWARVAWGGAADVDLAATAAHRAFTIGPWAGMTPTERGKVLVTAADALAAQTARLAEIEVRDNGKLLAEMRGQMDYIPEWFRYYGGLADKVEGSVLPLDKKGYFAFTRKQPVGVVGIITPWNSPLLLLAWKLAPALAAGCTVVIKPSEFTSASTLEFVRILEEAGVPAGVVNVVTGFGHDVGARLVDHPLVRKIGFTGSDATGRLIGAQAAAGLKRCTLELGGKSPNIVFADADLDAAVNGVVSGIFAATGQTCIAGSRLLVEESIHDDFVDRLVRLARRARIGDPMSPGTQVGPVTTRPQLAKILGHIDQAVAAGATTALGGQVPATQPSGGWFVEPTIFTGVTPEMDIAQEEVFGPVLAVIPFRDESEAVRLANSTRFGLGAGIWTSNIERAFRMSDAVDSGMVWVNAYRTVSFMAPFGGMKDSGVGRENGSEAISDYLETKTVWINTGAPNRDPFVLG
ncbi:aldehyde dehydrogenase [Arthrobacter sp. SDTb3-6]|uniref:aldehyde dehydrogenase n=1 Tax=Arthrobacter sp. SDTb3-6 TaxID=2713571 RepID=UPI001C3FFB3F